MKHGAWIGFVVAMLMAVCSSSPSASGRLASANPTLTAIDSLLWSQPDSAFALLHKDYSTVKRRSNKLRKAFSTEKTLQVFLMEKVS